MVPALYEQNFNQMHLNFSAGLDVLAFCLYASIFMFWLDIAKPKYDVRIVTSDSWTLQTPTLLLSLVSSHLPERKSRKCGTSQS